MTSSENLNTNLTSPITESCQVKVKDNFLEIETKYDTTVDNRLLFKELVKSIGYKKFEYIESTDIYYVKSDEEFLRYRMSADNSSSKRSELTFKKKHIGSNNIVRTEVNLRVDLSDEKTVEAFCEGLGYTKNFSIYKICDIYKLDQVTLVYYSVKGENNLYNHFIEIEVKEDLNISKDEAWDIIRKYETLLMPLGITAQKRKRLSLYEMYRKPIQQELGVKDDGKIKEQ